MSDTNQQIFVHPKALRATKRVLTGDDLAALRALAEERAPDPSVFEQFPPYFWTTEGSNNIYDAYSTRMALSTLKNYASDAAAGVAFQDSHNTFELGLGRSLTGKFIGAQGNGLSRFIADFYTIPGLVRGAMPSDSFINGVRAGVYVDVSVGFYGGRFVCDLCGQNMMGWECPHIPGIEAEIEDKKNPKVKRVVVATATIEDAHLAEVSAVYDGATPNAVIIKAQQEMDGGRLQPKTARLLEQTYRINLPGARHLFAGIGEGTMKRETPEENPEPNEEGNEPERPEQNAEPPEPTAEQAEQRAMKSVRAVLKGHGIKDEEMPSDLRSLCDFARDGMTYRADLIKDALAEGVRAHGDKFNRERYERTLKASDIETIKLMRDDWKRAGDEIFNGGRKTVDTREKTEAQPAKVRVPGLHAA